MKKGVISIFVILSLVMVMSLSAFAQQSNNGEIGSRAVIYSCPVCMSRNISTEIVSKTYFYEGQTRYVREISFDYCRDCGFRTSNRTIEYIG